MSIRDREYVERPNEHEAGNETELTWLCRRSLASSATSSSIRSCAPSSTRCVLRFSDSLAHSASETPWPWRDENTTLCSTWSCGNGRGTATRPDLVIGVGRRSVCVCDQDAEVETDSAREGVEECEPHDTSDCGEDSLFLFVWNAASSGFFVVGCWRNEESLCGCGA